MEKKSSGRGVTFTGLLTCIFVALKLMKVITWSWFWVLSPLIFTFILNIIVLAVVGLVAIIVLVKDGK